MKPFIKIMKALSDPNRVKIIKLLQHKEMCVCEMQAALKLAQPTVSKHLTVLRTAGIVDDERKGQTVEYRLVIPCVVEFLNCAIKVIEERKKM